MFALGDDHQMLHIVASHQPAFVWEKVNASGGRYLAGIRGIRRRVISLIELKAS
jgi:hypothetical protein